MDLQDEHYEEVYKILFQNLSGLHFDQLYDKCKQFEEKTDLSRCLHRAAQQGTVRKLPSGLYVLTPVKYLDLSGGQEMPEATEVVEVKPEVKNKQPDAVTEEIRKLMETNPNTKDVIGKIDPPKHTPRVVRVERKVQEEAKPVKVELSFGDLQRSKALGGAALALYRIRDDANPYLTLSDLSELTGCSNVVLSQRMAVLIERKYVIKDVSDGVRRPKFKWSGNFRYPFDQWRKSDDRRVKDQPNMYDHMASAILAAKKNKLLHSHNDAPAFVGWKNK